MKQTKAATHPKKSTPKNPKSANLKISRTTPEIEAFCTLTTFHGVAPSSGGLRIKGEKGEHLIVEGKAERVKHVGKRSGKQAREVFELIAATPGYVPDAKRDEQFTAWHQETGERIRVTGVRRKPKSNAKSISEAVVTESADTATAAPDASMRSPPRKHCEPLPPLADARFARELQVARIQSDAGFDPPVKLSTACVMWNRSLRAVRGDIRCGVVPKPFKIGHRDYLALSVVEARMTGKPLLEASTEAPKRSAGSKGIGDLDRPFG